ncbi:AmmeMemoRadiSam system protein B [Vibrio sp. PP-XX7]
MDDWLGMEADVGQPIQALIVPHAGYIYSGQVAAAAFRHLKSQADRIHRVIMIGPSHRFHFPGCALSAVDFFSSPLGDIPLIVMGQRH